MTTWKTDSLTGLVTVDFDDGRGLVQPTLSLRQAKTFKNNVVDQWSVLLHKYADANGVPFSSLAGIVWQESGGNPKAINKAEKDAGKAYGVGLMQLTSAILKDSHTENELMDPELNIKIGSEFYGKLWKSNNRDLPTTAAAYNAGAARPCNSKCCDTAWGLCATVGHITGVVSANNTSVLNQWNGDVVPLPEPETPSMVMVAPAGVSSSNSAILILGGGLLGYLLWKQLSPNLGKFVQEINKRPVRKRVQAF